jgi:hypothetical protein
MPRSRIVTAIGGWRREMQHREWRGTQPAERAPIVEIPHQWNDAIRPQLADVVAVAREPDKSHAMTQTLRDAQCDIPATDEQYPLHHAVDASCLPANPSRTCATERAARKRMVE